MFSRFNVVPRGFNWKLPIMHLAPLLSLSLPDELPINYQEYLDYTTTVMAFNKAIDRIPLISQQLYLSLIECF